MLLRGKKSVLGAGSVLDEGREATVEAPRRRERTPIYARDPLRNWISAEDPVPKSPGRRLSAILRDGKFHDVADVIEDGVNFDLMLVAMEELLRSGRAFDRVGQSLRLRMLRVGESPQDLMVLVDGLEVFPREEVVETSEVSEPSIDSTATEPDEFSASVDPREVSSGLVLSDPPGDLTMPLSWLGSMVNSILAQRGAGKSYLGMVLAEEILRVADRPRLVIFDPTGAWWGLGASSSGGSPSHDFAILGGPRGHLSITPSSGRLLARVAHQVDAGALVVDLSEMAPAEQHEVVADFCEELLGLPAFPIHVVFDEADEFVPQQCDGISPHQSRARGYVTRLVMRGRKKGIGATLISLRPAIVSKNVLSQVDALFLLRMVETNDLRAVEGWLDNFEGGISAEHRARCLGSLPMLPVGAAYYLRGGEEVTFRRFRTRRKTTFDSSRTPDGTVRLSVVLRAPRSEILESIRRILSQDGSADR